jgi:hypothetical protein
MSSRHADDHGEYLRLGCAATQRLLASRFASQYQAATAVGNVYSLASFSGGTVVRVTGRRCFVHTLWISVWKRDSPRHGRHTAKVHTTADFALRVSDWAGMREEQRRSSDRTF